VHLIGQLFAVEKQAKDVSVVERLALRQTQSVPVLVELRRKLLTWKEQLLPKHPMAEAVNYAQPMGGTDGVHQRRLGAYRQQCE
jgi:hypothetical protein